MKQATLLVPPKIQAMMTGATIASIQGQRVTLTYTDGRKETAVIDLSPTERENWFTLVSRVQEAARKTTT